MWGQLKEATFVRARKPKELIVGRAYRMWGPFCAWPSDQIAVVTEIKQVTKRMRTVRVEWLREGPGWGVTGYGDFLRRVFCEVAAIN